MLSYGMIEFNSRLATLAKYLEQILVKLTEKRACVKFLDLEKSKIRQNPDFYDLRAEYRVIKNRDFA